MTTTADQDGSRRTRNLPEQGPDLGRLVAQRGFFAGPFDRVPADLYARGSGAVQTDRNRARLEARSSVSFDTYFGRFPASYWQRWTSASEVVLEAVLSGTGMLRVYASDALGSPRILTARTVTHIEDHEISVAIPIDRFVDGGSIWAEFSTEDSLLRVSDVRWTVLAPPTVRPTALIMCTHDRADDCLSTLGVLAEDEESRRMLDAVYVIDQGNDRVDSRAAFEEVTESFGTSLRYIRQHNLGGSGGFTRGLYEVAEVESADHANVLFMDDDILLEPDVVIRLTAFANRSVEPVIVGAQMLHLLHPTKLHVSAETARFTTIEPGLPVAGSLNKADVTENAQHRRVDADYNAWWTCLIPSEVVADAGYPLPFFFQWDDVEYGYRARARGHATVTLPGAAVWHHDFDWKDEDDWARYFTLRNALAIDALHGHFQPKASAAVAARWIAECLVSMRYGEAATLIQAVEDFLRGPETFRDGGVAALSSVRELRRAFPETEKHPASTVAGLPAAGRPLEHAGWRPSRDTAVLVKRFVLAWTGRPGGTASIAAEDAAWWHVSRFRTAVVTDRSQECVRLRSYDRGNLRSLTLSAASTIFRLRRHGDRAASELRAAAPELSSRASWRRLFQL